MDKENHLTEQDISRIKQHLRDNGVALPDKLPVIKNLTGGTSRGTFLIIFGDKKYIVSVFRKKLFQFLKVNNPANSHRFQKFLSENGLNVPKLIGETGKLPGKRIYQIQEFVEGIQPVLPDEKQMGELGTALAELHKISALYHVRPNFKSRYHNIIRLLADCCIRSRFAYIPHESFINTFTDYLLSRQVRFYPSGMVHGGVRLPNIIFQNEKIFLIDFEGAHYSAYWRDIARPIGTMCCRIINENGKNIFEFDEKLATVFLRKYYAERPLTTEEILMLPGKALLFAERSIKYDGIDSFLSLSEKVEKLKTIEAGLAKIDSFAVLGIEKPVYYLGFNGRKTTGILGLRLIITAIYTRIMNKFGITTLRQLKDESLEWSNKFGHPITWDPYMKGGKGGFNRRGRDDARDAFRHCYAGAVSTFELGAWVSALIGDIRKVISLQNKKAVEMDIINNRIGRKIGKEMRSNYKKNKKKKVKIKIAEETDKLLSDRKLIILNNDTIGPGNT